MSFLLDTDTCSAYMKGNSLIFNRFMQYAGRLHMLVVTLGELTIWACRATAPPKRAQDLQDLARAGARCRGRRCFEESAPATPPRIT